MWENKLTNEVKKMLKEVICSKDNSWILNTSKNIVRKLEIEKVIQVFKGNMRGGKLKYSESELRKYILETEKECRFCKNETDNLIPITFENNSGEECTVLYFLCCDECKKRPYLSREFIKKFKDISSMHENDEIIHLKKNTRIHTINCKCCGKQKNVLTQNNEKISPFCKTCYVLRQNEGLIFVKDENGNKISIIGTEEAENLVQTGKAAYNSIKEICILDKSELYIMQVQKENHKNILYVYENGLKSRIITKDEVQQLLNSKNADWFTKYVVREFS
jgi:hypothetical protein